MHASSILKVECFLRAYGSSLPRPAGLPRVLEVGSKSYSAQDTYRHLFPDERYSYTGLDLEAGPNVDLVPAKGSVWEELEAESIDLCISGQTFEHNPFFWVTFAEMARVLTPSGLLCIVAPGAGDIHRYPYDCWRFYPDSWLSLCALTGMELVETYFESDDTAQIVPGGAWRDSALIARKPELAGPLRATFYRRLEQIVEPLREAPIAVPRPYLEVGPCFRDYEAKVKASFPPRPFKRMAKQIKGRGIARLQDGDHFHGS